VTRDEVIDLLAIISGVNGRTVGETDVAVWLELVGDMSFADASAAVKAHYMESDRWIMPSHIRDRIKVMRHERLARTPLPDVPDEIVDDAAAYLAWERAARRLIADGLTDPKVITARASRTLRAIEAGDR